MGDLYQWYTNCSTSFSEKKNYIRRDGVARARHAAGNPIKPLLSPSYKFEEEKWRKKELDGEEKEKSPS
jgi:hypothetical protein